jgi:hypothetical protein
MLDTSIAATSATRSRSFVDAVAWNAARIEGLATRRDVREVGTPRMEIKAERTIGPCFIHARFDSFVVSHERSDAVSTSADNKLSRSKGTWHAGGIERLPTLVIMVMPGQHDLDPVLGNEFPN